MKPDESAATRLIHTLNRQIDDLIVQLSLGKSEAAAHVEHSREILREKLAAARRGLSHSETHQRLAAKLDHLRVQLHLGGMESRDAYQAQRETIHHAINETLGEFHHLDERVREDLTGSAETLKLKLNALGLTIGLGALVAEDELKTRKDEFSAKASRLAGRLKASASAVGHEAESAAHEARIAFEDIRDNLKRLFH